MPSSLLTSLLDFVTDCRAHDFTGSYPHIGDLQWWFRDPSMEDESSWKFWTNETGNITAVCQAVGNEYLAILHPRWHTQELAQIIRSWAIDRLHEQAHTEGNTGLDWIQEEACDDDPDNMALLEREGYIRQDLHGLQYRRRMDISIREPQLPEGFVIRNIEQVEIDARAALHHDAFNPNSSMMPDTYRRVTQMPGYDMHLDLVAVATDGTFAAGCICWMDDANRIGLFEPLGTHPAFRRKGLATALMLEGLHRLKQRGAETALVVGGHPGEVGGWLPVEFTSSRHVFEAVGFQLQRRIYKYIKEFG